MIPIRFVRKFGPSEYLQRVMELPGVPRAGDTIELPGGQECEVNAVVWEPREVAFTPGRISEVAIHVYLEQEETESQADARAAGWQ